MNAINNRFLKNVCMDFAFYGCAVHFDFFICTISCKNIKLEYCYANWSMTIEFSPEMNNTQTSNYLLVISSI